jgi:hypothetical protein
VRWLYLVVLAGCSFEHGLSSGSRDGAMIDTPDGEGSGSGSGSGSGMSSPLRQKTITIASGIVGTHVDFPLWISLTDPDLATRALANGSDIHFVAGSTPLAFEIQSFTKATGRLDAWVRVPSLAAGTTLLMRYGDATVAHPADSAATFSGYQAVWHFEDTLAAATIDDARNLRNGTAISLTTADSVAGQLGRGINFSDGTDQITFTNPLTGAGPHTISAWINQRATTSNDCIMQLGNGTLNEARWFHSRYNTSTMAVGFYTNDFVTVDEDIIADNWVLVTWVFEGANRVSRIYVDGELEAGPFTHNAGINTAGTAGSIGNAAAAFGTNMGINATLDEVRITNVARNANWIAAEALNQTTPAASYSISAEQVP